MTVLDTDAKPTRPPPKKIKFGAKPLAASDRIRPTAKPRWGPPASTRREKPAKPRRKNKQETNAQVKKKKKTMAKAKSKRTDADGKRRIPAAPRPKEQPGLRNRTEPAAQTVASFYF